MARKMEKYIELDTIDNGLIIPRVIRIAEINYFTPLDKNYKEKKKILESEATTGDIRNHPFYADLAKTSMKVEGKYTIQINESYKSILKKLRELEK